MEEVASKRPRFVEVEVCSYKEGVDYSKLFAARREPLVVKGLLDKWPCSSWSIDVLADIVKEPTRFRCSTKHNSTSSACDDVMETDCTYALATIREFYQWLHERGDHLEDVNPFKALDRSIHWCYADYKYMNELFEKHPGLLLDVRWHELGFNGRDGRQSTIWIGSEEANTPCHMDTYGTNLVAQIDGRKRWTLYDKHQSRHLVPTRIPYEESSIFCERNKMSQAERIEITLCPGDILFVPKHWWHFVECLEPSVSVNTWVEEKTDDFDRLKEALARLLVCGFKQFDSEPEEKWLNPTEENYGFDEHNKLLKAALTECIKKRHGEVSLPKNNSTTQLKFNDILNCIVSDSVLEKIAEGLLEKATKE